MKKNILLIIFMAFAFCASAQEFYSIDGTTYELKTKVKGNIDLLWNIIDREYRYFVQKDNSITELVNSKGDNNKFQEEYKTTLRNLTTGSNLGVEKVKLTLFSLSNFIDAYNASVEPNYVSISKPAKINARLLIFGGITNSPFIENTNNIKTPLFGAEIAIFEANHLPRHALYFQIKHVLDADDFKYKTTQLTLGYRYRFISREAFNIYANIDVATYSFSKSEITYTNEADESITDTITNNSFDVPFVFGVGVDFKISNNGFITLTYNELFALFLDNNDNFSTNFAIGYKINL